MRNYMKHQQQSAITHINIPNINTIWIKRLVLCCFEIVLTTLPYKQAFYTAIWIYQNYNWDNYVGAHAPHKIVVEKEELEEALHNLHVKHFGQAHGTDFTIPPLSTLFGEYTETEFNDNFRHGKVDIDSIEGISPLAKMILHDLKPKPTEPPK
eukprot:2722548-Ditylum_brightwellii.AAC.1